MYIALSFEFACCVPDIEALGCAYVVLDTYLDDPEALRHSETSWRMLGVLAEKVLDLGNQTVR